MAIAEPKQEVPAAAPPAGEPNPTLQRLEDQIAWYDRKSSECQRRFKVLKAIVIAAAASIPVVAAFDVPVYVAGILGAVVVVTEGLVQVNQYHQNWITYRSTAESLKHEKYLFLARADIYSGRKKPLRLLAERIEGLISQEHARWVSSRRQHVDADEDEDEEERPPEG
jgi:hypothetical protein